MTMTIADAFEILKEEVEMSPRRADMNINVNDFFDALERTIERIKNKQWEDYMGEDL